MQNDTDLTRFKSIDSDKDMRLRLQSRREADSDEDGGLNENDVTVDSN